MTDHGPTPARSLRQRWAAGEETLGAWLTLANTHSAGAVATMGFAFVCVDTQHGLIDHAAAMGMAQAIDLAGATRSPGCRGTSPGSSVGHSTPVSTVSSCPW